MRKAGVLLHPTSFPSDYGIGDLGESAYRFIDFLKDAGQSLWQILPLGHTGFGDSPYQSASAFAGNPLLISPDILLKKKYITEKDIKPARFEEHRVDYAEVIEYKYPLYRKAYAIFRKKSNKAFDDFCSENSYWLDDYALFCALKDFFIEKRRNEFESAGLKKYAKSAGTLLSENTIRDCYYGASWNSFPEKLRRRDSAEIKKYEKKLADEIGFYKFLQFEFFAQWLELKEYANSNGIKIIGDMPIFVSSDCADVWCENELFCVNPDGFLSEVAGVPPDYFSEKGQLWGNPLYNWEKHESEGFEWWKKRIKHSLGLMDIVRIDHFRAFESYWSIPGGSVDATKGKWKKAPGSKLFSALEKELGALGDIIIAEDLGDLNDEVFALRDSFGLKGMKILQFAFSDSGNLYLPHNYNSDNYIAYTGTHDNDTTLGWYSTLDEKQGDYVRRLLNISGDDISWDLIRLCYSSCALWAIIPLQDILSLPSPARMNTPGSQGDNWSFRYKRSDLTSSHIEGLKYLCALFNR